MARKKKSRKIGLIGVRKTPDFKRVEKQKRVKKALGNPAGNRNSLAATSKDANKGKTNNDPRLGSKKPIELNIPSSEIGKVSAKPLVKHFSPESELAQIEGDEKLAQLVGKLDSDIKLDKQDQLYVTSNLARHKELCALLGITDDTELDDIQISSTSDENDLYEMFEKIDVNQLKNF